MSRPIFHLPAIETQLLWKKGALMAFGAVFWSEVFFLSWLRSFWGEAQRWRHRPSMDYAPIQSSVIPLFFLTLGRTAADVWRLKLQSHCDFSCWVREMRNGLKPGIVSKSSERSRHAVFFTRQKASFVKKRKTFFFRDFR